MALRLRLVVVYHVNGIWIMLYVCENDARSPYNNGALQNEPPKWMAKCEDIMLYPYVMPTCHRCSVFSRSLFTTTFTLSQSAYCFLATTTNEPRISALSLCLLVSVAADVVVETREIQSCKRATQINNSVVASRESERERSSERTSENALFWQNRCSTKRKLKKNRRRKEKICQNWYLFNMKFI